MYWIPCTHFSWMIVLKNCTLSSCYIHSYHTVFWWIRAFSVKLVALLLFNYFLKKKCFWVVSCEMDTTFGHDAIRSVVSMVRIRAQTLCPHPHTSTVKRKVFLIIRNVAVGGCGWICLMQFSWFSKMKGTPCSLKLGRSTGSRNNSSSGIDNSESSKVVDRGAIISA